MKLRIKGDSIRLRLLQSEVRTLAAEGRISQATRFGSTELKYGILIEPSADRITSAFEYHEIVVVIPEDQARDWIEGDKTGIGAKQDIGNGRSLDILIEKDLVCLGRPDDPENFDAFLPPEPILERQ